MKRRILVLCSIILLGIASAQISHAAEKETFGDKINNFWTKVKKSFKGNGSKGKSSANEIHKKAKEDMDKAAPKVNKAFQDARDDIKKRFK